MDNMPSLHWTDEEIELRLLQRAVDEALNDPREPIPNEIVCAEMQREIEEIDRQIAALMTSEG